jgi:phosphoribosylaminoimidazole (AIR) synthetase
MDGLIAVLKWIGKASVAMLELTVVAIGAVAVFFIEILAASETNRNSEEYSDTLDDGLKNASARARHEALHGEGTYSQASYDAKEDVMYEKTLY